MRKQKPKTLKPRTRNANRAARAAARPPAALACPDALESALAAAARIAKPYPEEAEAIENVIRYVRGHRHARPDEIQLADVLLALSILITAIDREPSAEERAMFAALDAMLGVPQRRAVRVPTAAHHAPSTIAPARLTSHARRCAQPSSPIAPYSRIAA